MTRRARAVAPLTAAVTSLLLASGPSLGAAPAAAASDGGTQGSPVASEGRAYPGDPEKESALVAAEDSRLIEVRTVGVLARWKQQPVKSPYRLATGGAYTLVLTERSDPYTVEDLLDLAPQTFVRQPDGAFLLSEHVVVESGATLNLADPGGLRLLLASDADGFVSIINDGGRLNIAGTEGSPAVVTSFDREDEATDTLTDDGRAYIRSIGGQVSISDAELRALGFWSGRTGGLSLTGTDRPNSGSLDRLADSLEIGAVPGTGPTVQGNRDSALGEVLPAGDLPLPVVDVDAPRYSFVSAALDRTSVTQSAFGLFVSGASGLDVRDSTFDRNLVSGLVLHRYVVNAVVEGTSAGENGQDGIVLARATTGIVLSEVRTEGNARNGVTISGRPLADGPSATGTSVGSYGNNTITNSVSDDNGRYGVEVIGGTRVRVLANQVRANSVGIVVRDLAQEVSVIGNTVNASGTQGIAVRDGVTDGVVSGNLVDGGETSLYIRDSEADVEHNTLTGASNHAVSIVGRAGDTVVDANTLTGRGPSAIETNRAEDVDRTGWDNDTRGWHDTTPFLVTLKRFLQPLTLMWLLLGALLLFTAVRGARARPEKLHPYADKRPLHDPSAVVVPDRVPQEAGR
ncbi:right-handed parallel beta-helix repeat-containing protein [Nocardioides campestrisoli]|uniref:right-handed parallel beta-helix repeat-containing protein n=1 Tax=Nocardioides campestrisoli TaxID=2736757 RepID=UPI00163D5930|nr:right-handed parallel beta-helix repeat-containing protein [Nocardioides campestrisoli]